MSRQSPIHISDTEEEPEYASDEVTSEREHSPVVHRATSDGTIDTPPSPPTDPTTQMLGSISLARRHLIGEPSYRPTPRRIPVPCVRDFPVGPSSSRGKEPMTEDREVPRVGQLQQRVRPPHLDWMPRILHHWRTLERIPATIETGESSRSPTPLPLTGEPLELTVPTAVAVIRTLLGFHYDTQDSIRVLSSDTSRLVGDVLTLYGRVATSEIHIDVDRESADATRARLIRLERRVSVVVTLVGFCALMAIVGMIVGWCLPYFH